ncbi:uncharacterized protein LOC107646535 [Arachis ipaensis]|uniref:uncharacterized protein LOC107646535 n=1 Tax=Arachis ipaensis TaxID=130454 RepID=UPI0007AF46FD|nr:uncharacterized protein LOC107646535 [Arachis ipaensis]
MPSLTSAGRLPHDIWTVISSLVAADSVHSLCAMQMVCRATRDAGREGVALASVSIPCPIEMAMTWDRCHEAVDFFSRCRVSGNPKILFREGLRECFHRGHPDAGLDQLCSAAVKGHIVARYAASLATFLLPVRTGAMKQSVEWFRSVADSGLLRECMRLCCVVHLCPSRPEVQLSQIGDNLVCDSSCCSTRGKTRAIYNYYRCGSQYQHWRCYEGGRTLSCVKCRADYELILFVNWW